MATSKKKARKPKSKGVLARMADGRVLLLSVAAARRAMLTKRSLQAKLAVYRPTNKIPIITTMPPLPHGWGQMDCKGRADWINGHNEGPQWNRAVFEYFDKCDGRYLQ